MPDAGFIDAGDDVLGFGIPRKDQTHRVRPLIAHPAQKLDARSAGHALVGQHDVHELAPHHGIAFLGGQSGKHGEIFFERAPQRFQGTLFVVDDKHGQRGVLDHGMFQPRSR